LDFKDLRIHDTATGCSFRVRVKASAKQDTLTAVHAGLLKITVVAAPERGKANEAVARLLAGVLNVMTSRVHVVSGFTSTDKMVEVTGASSADVRARFEKMPRFSTGRH
jgi:uncharacterized protein YggU (UPF0235/DUF167 family)